MTALLTGASRIDSVAQFATVLLAFIFVLAITVVATRVVGNYQKKQGFSNNFEIIEGFRISNNKYLELIRIGKRYYVIAVGKDEVSLISEIDEGELELAADGGPKPGAFGKIFALTKDKLNNKGGSSDEKM